MKELCGEEKDYAVSVGKRIREARENCGFTMQELGDMIGITVNQLYLYETGKHIVRDIVLKAIAIKLSVKYEWLNGTSDNINNDEYSDNEKRYSENDFYLLSLFNKLSDHDKEFVMCKMRCHNEQ